MYKYNMIIDGVEYKAIFIDHIEVADFIDDNEQDGSEVVVEKFSFVNINDVLNDDDFGYAYKIEMISICCFGSDEIKGMKIAELEKALKSLNII